MLEMVLVIEAEGSWLHGALSCLGKKGDGRSTGDLRLVIGLLLVNRYLFSNYHVWAWAWPWEVVVSKFLPWMSTF